MNWLRDCLGRIVANVLFILPVIFTVAFVFLGGVFPRQEPQVR